MEESARSFGAEPAMLANIKTTAKSHFTICIVVLLRIVVDEEQRFGRNDNRIRGSCHTHAKLKFWIILLLLLFQSSLRSERSSCRHQKPQRRETISLKSRANRDPSKDELKAFSRQVRNNLDAKSSVFSNSLRRKPQRRRIESTIIYRAAVWY